MKKNLDKTKPPYREHIQLALCYIEVSLYIQELSEFLVLPAEVIAKAERNILAQVSQVSVLG